MDKINPEIGISAQYQFNSHLPVFDWKSSFHQATEKPGNEKKKLLEAVRTFV